MVELLGSASEAETKALLDGLSPNAIKALPWLFDFWALPHQRPPQGDWSTWVLMGGRGAGKTRAGSEWVRAMVEGSRPMARGKVGRVALIGETFDQVREVMIFGESGILASTPPDRRPAWQATRKRLEWPNGAVAYAVSAGEPEALRGPQFDAAWCDELAKWRKAREVWDMLQFTLRLGDDPKQLITTTPRNVAVLKDILKAPDTVVTTAPTSANRANLAPKYLQKIMSDYHGSRLGRQEIDGELLEDQEGALWSLAALDAERVRDTPRLSRIVVAVDPPASSGANADACGIIVAGVCQEGPPQDWRVYVLADLSVTNATPNVWAAAVAAAYDRFEADRVVAEVNQGGEMVETVLRAHAPLIPYRAVRASKGKVARAEPIAALYEQGRVAHRGLFKALENEMSDVTAQGYMGAGSPDRVDALVWALTDLMVEPAARYMRPSIRLV